MKVDETSRTTLNLCLFTGTGEESGGVSDGIGGVCDNLQRDNILLLGPAEFCGKSFVHYL